MRTLTLTALTTSCAMTLPDSATAATIAAFPEPIVEVCEPMHVASGPTLAEGKTTHWASHVESLCVMAPRAIGNPFPFSVAMYDKTYSESDPTTWTDETIWPYESVAAPKPTCCVSHPLRTATVLPVTWPDSLTRRWVETPRIVVPGDDDETPVSEKPTPVPLSTAGGYLLVVILSSYLYVSLFATYQHLIWRAVHRATGINVNRKKRSEKRAR